MPVFLNSLKAQGKLENLLITICNVGSRKSYESDDLGRHSWGFFAPNLTLYGFDADADACEDANQDLEKRRVNWVEKHIPAALADGKGERTIYVTKNPMCASLYQPNESYLSRFNELLELAGLDFTLGIETISLDEICEIENIKNVDFLQIDVQGAELLVLEGASKLLEKNVLAIKTEVEFSPLYINQPLFAEIDLHLRKYNFTLFDIDKSYIPRRKFPVTSRLHPGQLLWGDAYYFRDLIGTTMAEGFRTPENIFKLACMADLMEFTDYALELLTYLTVHYGQDSQYHFVTSILEGLAGAFNLSESEFNSLEIVKQIREL
jgi:FkbM family methyltransferase